MEKILYNRLLRPVLAVVMVVSLALGVASSAWPAARQSARIAVLAEAGITNLRTLSIAVTELGEDRLAALIKTPMQGNDFKKMSGLLTEVRDAAGYDRIWLTAQKDGKTIVLCDSSYRDTGTAGQRVDRPVGREAGLRRERTAERQDRGRLYQVPGGNGIGYTHAGHCGSGAG